MQPVSQAQRLKHLICADKGATLIRLVRLGLSTGTMVGCTGPQVEQPMLDCEVLHQAVRAASDDFDSLKGHCRKN